MTTIETTDVAEQRIAALEAEVRSLRSAAVVRSEPRAYGVSSEASYFQDVALATRWNDPGSQEARDRMARYSRELDVEVEARSREGLRAERVTREAHRSETRNTPAGITSTTTAGFTTPVYLVDEWATFRSPARAFTDQTTLLPLPEYGLQVNIPSFSGTTSVGTQIAENQGVDIAAPSGANLQANLTTQAGQVDISQQLYDRGGLPGLAFDKITMLQLKEQLDAAVDVYVLGQAIAGAGTVTDNSSATIGTLYDDLALAREQLSDTLGTRLVATHVFSTTDFYGWATHQLDSEGRPILVPDSGALIAAQALNDPKWNSWTGVHLGQLRWHSEDNIPPVSGNTQLVVCRPKETFSFIGDEITFSYEQTAAQNLTVFVGLRAYVAAIVRFPKSIAVVTGSAYPVSLT